MSDPNQQLRFHRRNRAYYADLERLHQLLVAPGLRVLEIGCGLGDLLAQLRPSHGVGVELDPELAAAAQQRHPQLRIVTADAETITPASLGEGAPFDVILLPNTLNTLQDVQGVLERLEAFCHPRTRLVVSFHNWLWQPLLKAAEGLGQRQPQPPESWLTPNDVRNLLDLAGWEVLKQGQRCLVPRRIPVLAPLANRWLSQLPLLEQLGLTHWMVARPGRQQPQNPSVSVVIPARNEAGNIAAAVERLPELGRFTEVLFVEGHSSDHTWPEIERVCASYQGPLRLRKFRQSGKGKADAVWLGFEQAEGEVLMILDADLTVRPEDLPRFAEAMAEGRGEFVNGCRLVYPRSWAAMPPLNTAANRFFAAVFSWLLRQRLKDTLCGTKVIWRDDYQRLKAGRSYFGDFDPFGDFDLLFGASKLNLKIVEVPVRYQERSYGSSNIAHVKEGLILARMCLVAARKLRFIPLMQRRLLLGLVAALAVYLGLTTVFGLEQVGSSLRALPWFWWLVGPAICLTSHLLLLGRWQFYLQWLGYPLPLRAGARIYGAGLALIAAPGRSGEALRGLWLQRRHGFPLTVGVGITLAERLADLASALLVLSWGLGRQVWSAALIGALVLGAGGWLLTHPRVLQRLERGLEGLPLHRRWQGLIRLLREALLAMGRMRQLMKPRPLLVGTLLACACWLLEAGLLVGLYGALGVAIDWRQAAVIRTATGLGGVVSLLPAGLGTSEATSIGLAMLYGAGRSQALAVTLVLRLCTLALPCLIGVVALMAQPDLSRRGPQNDAPEGHS